MASSSIDDVTTIAPHTGIVASDKVHSSSLVATRLAPTKPKPVLYLSATCPYAHKAWLALLEMKVDFNAKFEDLGNKSAALNAAYAVATPDAGSAAKVPVFIHDGVHLVESNLVARYIVETFEENAPSVLPKTACDNYRTALFVETFGAVGPPFFAALRATSVKDVDAAAAALIAVLTRTERCLELGGNGGPFVLGKAFTYGDLVSCTMVPRLTHVLKHYRNMDVVAAAHASGLTRVARWMDAVLARPSMVTTMAEAAKEHGAATAGLAYIEHSAKFVTWRADDA